MATYVVSDLHGQYEVFRNGLKKIGFSGDDMLYVIGDAIDRGSDGIRILREIRRKDNMDLLIGNHEFMMLNSVNPEGKPKCDGRDSDLWLYWNGGVNTFGKYRYLPPKERMDLLSWLNTRKLTTTVRVNTEIGKQDYTLTHSFFDPEYEDKEYKDIPYKKVWDIVWRSLFRPDTPCENVYRKYEDRIFITGHVPVQRLKGSVLDHMRKLPEPYREGNLMNIDGGMSYEHYGIMNAAIFLRLEDMKYFTSPLSHEGFEKHSF